MFIFFGGGAGGLVVIIVALIKHFKAVDEVTQCYKKQGVEWDYMYNFKLRSKFALNPDFTFLEATDSPELRQAKLRFLKSRESYKTAFGVAALILIAAFFGTFWCTIAQQK